MQPVVINNFWNSDNILRALTFEKYRLDGLPVPLPLSAEVPLPYPMIFPELAPVAYKWNAHNETIELFLFDNQGQLSKTGFCHWADIRHHSGHFKPYDELMKIELTPTALQQPREVTKRGFKQYLKSLFH